MIAWLTETLAYTGVLIALVLVLRRPVASHFGPQMSYALWALPLLRFIMPPIVLPASLAPQGGVVGAPAATITVAGDGMPAAAIEPAEIFYVAEPTFWESWGPTIVAAMMTVWLAGAAAFLLWRGWTYFRMREWLLAGARPMGEAGNIRLVETPAVSSPVAFGVSDKVIALPVGFMASENRAARDLAIEHELAHHRGRDLLANILAQPILALHWFNPLAWMGWRAMRRDQEAACDARVIASRGLADRAVYGQVIASFASGQRLALAAPMACPVLGEKSIIHRLRSLSRTEISPRRRMAGRALLAGAALALPLTASISYAHPDPAALAAPKAPKMVKGPITIIDVPEGADPSDRTLHTKVIEKDGQTIVLKTSRPVSDEEAQARIERAQESMSRAEAFSFSFTQGKAPSVEQRQILARMRHPMTGEEWRKFGQEWEKKTKEWEKQGREHEEWARQWEKWGEEYGRQWEAQGQNWVEQAKHAEQASRERATPFGPVQVPVKVSVQVPKFGFTCNRSGQLVRVQRGNEGDTSIDFCNKFADSSANARRALEQARSRIQHDRALDDHVRDQVLESLDREIDRLEEHS